MLWSKDNSGFEQVSGVMCRPPWFSACYQDRGIVGRVGDWQLTTLLLPCQLTTSYILLPTTSPLVGLFQLTSYSSMYITLLSYKTLNKKLYLESISTVVTVFCLNMQKTIAVKNYSIGRLLVCYNCKIVLSSHKNNSNMEIDLLVTSLEQPACL